MSSIYITSPLLIPSLYSKDVNLRPLSVHDALLLTTTANSAKKVQTNAIVTDTANNNTSTTTAVLNVSENSGSAHDSFGTVSTDVTNTQNIPTATINNFVYLLTSYIVGKAIGQYLFTKRRKISLVIRSIPLLGRLLLQSRGSTQSRIPPSWRIVCVIISLIISLVIITLFGFGIETLYGYIIVRFVMGVLIGMLICWNDEQQQYANGSREDIDQQQIMEEGHSLLSRTTYSNDEDNTSSKKEERLQQLTETSWLNYYQIMGIASSSLISGYFFYPVNYLYITSFYNGSSHSERMYVLLLLVGVSGLIDRLLFRYYWKNRPTSFGSGGRLSSSPPRNKDDREVEIESDRYMSISQRSSTLSRRKQVGSRHLQRSSMFGEEQQRQRLNSNSTNPSDEDEFFDCLDDIEVDESSSSPNTTHDDIETGLSRAAATTTNTKQNENQIALYSQRRIIYSDGTSAYVPAGERTSAIPGGYLQLYKNNTTKAQAKYQATQEWRHQKQIQSIHSRPHTWFPKIKVAYPHVIHGYTLDGMPVVYESPGRMNLKELFRSGCSVDDMLFHYCYLMEYLSNLESILTELHENDNEMEEGRSSDDWQDELAGYAHTKQTRLQNDPVTFGFCVIMDVRGASPTSLSGDVLVYLKRAGDTNSSHYPGSQQVCVAVHAHWMMSMAFNVIKSTMPASAKVDLLSSAETTEGGLKKYISEDQIPVEYGGKSKFKLSEHPFEVGLRQLVERQGEATTAASAPLGSVYDEHSLNTPLSDVTESPRKIPTGPYHMQSSSNLPLDGGATTLKRDSPSSTPERGHTAKEWDGLGQDSILMVTSILQFVVYFIIGSLEVVLPYWIITPPSNGGMGYEPQRSGTAIFISCLIITWLNKRSRFSKLARRTIEKSALRGFRIGIGSTCFFLMCVGLIPYVALNPVKSNWALTCLSVYLSIIFLGISLCIISLECLRGIVGSSSMEQRSGSSRSSLWGRIAGYLCVMPIFRWSALSELSFPLNGSFALCILAGISWLLYIISFSLHTAPSSNIDNTKKKESQFMSAISIWVSFGKEVLVVTSSDIRFLLSELLSSGKGSRHRTV